ACSTPRVWPETLRPEKNGAAGSIKQLKSGKLRSRQALLNVRPLFGGESDTVASTQLKFDVKGRTKKSPHRVTANIYLFRASVARRRSALSSGPGRTIDRLVLVNHQHSPPHFY
ncbi:unnamed protein product, partial [Ectocarpus sp. 8 AP-2014]